MVIISGDWTWQCTSESTPLTPLAAVVGGLLAGAVGTVCLDAVAYFWLFTLQEDDLGSVMINGLLQSEDPRNKQH